MTDKENKSPKTNMPSWWLFIPQQKKIEVILKYFPEVKNKLNFADTFTTSLKSTAASNTQQNIEENVVYTQCYCKFQKKYQNPVTENE